MPDIRAPDLPTTRYPIIYVRGFAFSAGDRDETAADPYCGFNVGSTVYRATAADKERPKSFFFESPLVRLASEMQYRVLYRDGLEILDPAYASGEGGARRVSDGIDMASIVIHRYYDAGSALLGTGDASPIDQYARELASLIAMVRLLVRPRIRETAAAQGNAEGVKLSDEEADARFRCYLVAHSMGGLIVRALLQNSANDVPQLILGGQKANVRPVRQNVVKVFTYATPHNGIDFFGGMNVPNFISNVSNFNREAMSKYLDTVPLGGKLNNLPPDIVPAWANWFTMIGTNRSDYQAALGLSRTFVGRGSDGLVRIDNATLWARNPKGDDSQATLPIAKAFAYRSHSGVFGIVNSEEAYQNLLRFLFGDFRVELWLDIEAVELPPDVQAEEARGRDVDAIYQIELLVSTQGKPWYLSRRKSEEDSPACRSYKDIKAKTTKYDSVHLSSVFLMNSAKVSEDDPGVHYSVTLGIRAPDYEVERAFWRNGHYEGLSLFQDTLLVTLFSPEATQKQLEQDVSDGSWMVRYGWSAQGKGKMKDKQFTPAQIKEGQIVVEVSLPPMKDQATRGAIKANLRLVSSAWA
jgi:hypothetical protein